ncbi:MAG: deoxyribose-phosphate aldolase [Planctomycetota bacterium]|nr:MAG: deoxyribose-phosphate aldolase [Planctomycetota bacterium]
MNRRELALKIDHTILKPEAAEASIDQLCDEAVGYGFYAVCVNSIWIRHCSRRLAGSGVCVAGVAGFPLGADATEILVAQAKRAIDDGAVEVDMVIRIGDLVAGNISVVADDVAAVAEVIHDASEDYVLKVILETAALNEEQIVAGCRCAVDAGADFVKTSTGFHPAGGATVEAVRLLARHARPLRVKAAGGIRDLAGALAMLEAGADRLGCSAGVKIVNEIASV